MVTHSQYNVSYFSKLSLPYIASAFALLFSATGYASPVLQPTPEKHFYSVSGLMPPYLQNQQTSAANQKELKSVDMGSPDFNELLTKNIKPGTLTTKAQADGSFQINNSVQRVQASVNEKEAVFTSSSDEANKGGNFSVQLMQVGRDQLTSVAAASRVYQDGDVVLKEHKNITEKFTNTGNGIQQDFIIHEKPQGTGQLQVQLKIEGAALTQKENGVTVIPKNSQRKLTYDRLKVTDAKGKTIPAHMTLLANNQASIQVEDAQAQYPLTIDPTVGDANWVSMGIGKSINGFDNTVYALASDSSGNVYAGGSFALANGVIVSRIAKWNGSAWSALGTGMNSDVYALAIDSSGNVYAGGPFTIAGGVTVNRIAKWNGSAWSALGTGMNGTVNALIIDGSGNVYAGGGFDTAGGVSANYIAKWNGSAWSALGTGMNNTVNALAIDGSGNVYAGGSFTTADGGTVNYIAKWNGSAWSALGTGMDSSVAALAIDSSGNVYAGGNFFNAGGGAASFIAKWNVGTSTWSALGTGTSNSVTSLAIDSSDNVYAGGLYTTAGGGTANRIAKWNVGTSTWSALSTGVNSSVSALAIDSSGNVYAGGSFGTAGGGAATRIAKWNGSAWSAFVQDPAPTVTGLNNSVNALAIDGSGNVYAGGAFTIAGVVTVNRIAKWNGSAWSALGTGMNNTVNALAVDGSGNLYAGGGFHYSRWSNG